MCMACELLQGLDPEALAPAAGLPRHPVLLPEGTGSAAIADFLQQGAGPLAGRLRFLPPLHANFHWRPEPLRAALLELATAGGSPSLGIAAAAGADFRVWQARQDEAPRAGAPGAGAPSAAARCVVALPTPYSVIAALEPARYTPELLSRLEAAMAAELARLFEAVPPEAVAIQWDVCAETHIWESRGRDLGAARDLPERLLQSFVALAEAVPREAALGWHFCPRGADGQPVGRPHDSAQVVRLAGGIIASTDREPAYLHLPVPADRDDPDYYTPLANLGLWPEMDVYLGLVHPGDEVDAAWRRLFAAGSVLGRVGVAPACGADPLRVLPVMEQLLARVAAEVPLED